MTDASGAPRVLILADDLIWAERLVGAVAAVPAVPVRVGSLARFESELPSVSAAIVDLTARAYGGIDAVGRASAAGIPTLAVGQHDDHDLRKRALATGAARVLAYRKLSEDGPAAIATFLQRHVASPA